MEEETEDRSKVQFIARGHSISVDLNREQARKLIEEFEGWLQAKQEVDELKSLTELE